MTGNQSKPRHPNRKHIRCKYRRENLTVAPNVGPTPSSTEKDCGNGVGDLEIDLSASQEFDDVIHGEQEIKEHEDVANATSPADARSDQPASISDAKNEETQPTKSSLQEVLVDTTGLERQRHAVDSGTSTSASIEADAQYSDIDASMSEMGDISLNENVLTALSTTIDCTPIGNPVSDCTTFQSPTNERQRPTRVTDRPSRYKDSAFETQFQPTLRRRNCRKIQKRHPAGHDIINVRECQDLGRGESKKNVIPTGNENTTPITSQRIAKTTGQKKHFRHTRFITNFHLDPTEELLADPHSLKINQRGKEGKARSVMMSYPPTNTKKAEDPTKTLSAPQKRLRNAHLRSKLTPRPRASTDYRPAALRDRKANKAVSSDPPAACRCSRASTDAARPVITTSAASN